MRFFWTDRATQFPQTRDPARRRRLVYNAIDKGGFGWLVVLVAGVGFFTDAYVLFSSNVVLPMLAYVYWNTDTNLGIETAVNSVTLAGCIVGQIFFGIMADIYGRRKMYGVELIIIGGATLGVSMSSSGADDSMNVIGWLIFWRFIAGIGVGADYPLSAVITAEFAPRVHRPRMLATVFFMQPLGQLMASVVSVIAIAATDKRSFESDRAAVDSIWRWVIGVGAIPATVALFFRLTIPESPRYRLDVQNDSAKAHQDAEDFWGRSPDRSASSPLIAAASPRNSTMETLHLPHAAHHRVTSSEGSGTGEPGQVNIDQMVQRTPLQILQRDLIRFFYREGNWRHLFATAGTWFLLDFAFYGLGMNNPATIAKILNESPSNSTTPLAWNVEDNANKTIFQLLMDIATNALIVVSIGAVVGGAGLIYAISHFNRKKMQMWGFLALTALFIVIGATFPTISPGSFHGVTTTLFVICQIFFNFGPNALTFIIPAEIFPTKWRCTCHGISAAAGKLGSVLVQVFVSYVRFGNQTESIEQSPKLGYLLLVFSGFMAVGALLTWMWIPETQNLQTLENLSLEYLAKGRARVKRSPAIDSERPEEVGIAMSEQR